MPRTSDETQRRVDDSPPESRGLLLRPREASNRRPRLRPTKSRSRHQRPARARPSPPAPRPPRGPAGSRRALESDEGLDAMREGEEIEEAGGSDREAFREDRGQIARERGGIAGDVHEPGPRAAREVRGERGPQARPRRVRDDDVEAPVVLLEERGRRRVGDLPPVAILPG